MKKIALTFIGLAMAATFGVQAQESRNITTEEWRCYGLEDYNMLKLFSLLDKGDSERKLDKSSFEGKVLVRLTRETEDGEGHEVGEVSVAGITYTAVFRVVGFDRRWDFGEGMDYSFVISPDGYGAYFDFSNVDDGGETQPSYVYGCVQP